ncbi:MAG: hypothetical protein HYZ58_03590 [Acidobacteria bacterium]|nr:hypothetical protein [Acidobacteriota bacterium]
MKAAPWVVGAMVSVGLMAGALLGTAWEVLLGLAGPLAAAGASWTVAERTSRRHAERLTALLIKAFGGKMLFYAAYVVIVLEVLQVRPLPFVVSFTASFIACHVIEAFCLMRLFGGARASR